jgi:hypothetical protein
VNRQVWKFALPVNELTASFSSLLRIPVGAKLLHVAAQRNHACMWFEVDTEAEVEPRRFQLFGTGHGPIRDGLNYVGTCIYADGDLVLHIYEVIVG